MFEKVGLVFFYVSPKYMFSKVLVLYIRENDLYTPKEKTRFFWDTSYVRLPAAGADKRDTAIQTYRGLHFFGSGKPESGGGTITSVAG